MSNEAGFDTGIVPIEPQNMSSISKKPRSPIESRWTARSGAIVMQYRPDATCQEIIAYGRTPKPNRI